MKKVVVKGHSRNGKKVSQHVRNVDRKVSSAQNKKAGAELLHKKANSKKVEVYKPDSSHLNKVEYNTETGTMHVTFFNKAKYEYTGVDKKHFVGIKKAKSAGTYFHNHIRTSYPYKKL